MSQETVNVFLAGMVAGVLLMDVLLWVVKVRSRR